MTQVRIKVLRPFCVRGEPLAAGTVVELAASDAFVVLESGRAELLDRGGPRGCHLGSWGSEPHRAGRRTESRRSGQAVAMSAATIRLRATGPLLFGGVQRVRCGILFADPTTARELIAAGSAKLDDPSDIKLLIDEPADRRDSLPRPLRWQPR